MRESELKSQNSRQGSALVLAALAIFVLTIVGLGLLTVAYGARLHAVMLANEAAAKMTAQAGYEKAICWMSGEPDLFSTLQPAAKGRRKRGQPNNTSSRIVTGNVDFADSHAEYQISFDHFQGTRPVYRVESVGYCGRFKRVIDALVVQAVGGWDIASCDLPTGVFTSIPKAFSGNDFIDMPIHINSRSEFFDNADIYVSQEDKPLFTRPACVAESRYRLWGRNKDKYADIISLFRGGIYFDQPENKISDLNCLTKRAERFKQTTNKTFIYTHLTASQSVPNAQPAVQLEFYVDHNGTGKVRITRDCTVRCFPGGQYDYVIAAGNAGLNTYKKYDIYGYHYTNKNDKPISYKVDQTYVNQKVTTVAGDKVSSAPGGQIFVDGNVIIGGQTRPGGSLGGREILIDGKWYPNEVKGAVTVVATGNIWIVSRLYCAGQQILKDQGGFLVKIPDPQLNKNVIGLVSLNGVVKIIDPGFAPTEPPEYADLQYSRVTGGRMPNPMVVQAAITSGGGGWGAENYGSPLVGAICEATRGMVSEAADGYKKLYFFDDRLPDGILPGDMWLQSKYIPATGGWRDYRG
ncbi:MAG: hypothetical protein JRI34_13565 [Deltaproteobacteria bacterium]|nr:hypothetical protein [Deltaproteobacteria bacterium]